MKGYYYGWNIVGLTLVMQAISIGILIYSFALFVVPWLDEFGVSRRDAMVCVATLQLMTGFFSPIAGRLLDRLPARNIVLAGALALALGMILLSQAASLWQIIVIHGTLLPIGMSLTGPLTAQTLVARWFTERRGLAIGVSALGTSIGGFLFPLLNSLLISSLGWRITFMILAVLALILIVPLAWILLARSPAVADSATTISKAAAFPAEYRVWSTNEIFRSPMFWITIIAFVPINAAFGGVQFNLGAYSRDLGFGPEQAAFTISIISLSMICGKLFFGFLSDAVDHRWLYWLASSSLIIALLVFQGEPDLNRMRLGAVLMGFATGGVLPLSGIIISSRFGAASFGRVLGLYNLFLMVGAFGPLLAGWLFDSTGSYDAAFMVFLFLLLPAALTVAKLPPAVRSAKVE